MGVNVIPAGGKVQVLTTKTEVLHVPVPGPPGPSFLIDPTPEEEAAAPDGTVILTTN